MKQGRTLQELAIEINRQNNAKRDFLVPTSEIMMTSGISANELKIEGVDSFHINENAHRQLGEYCGIPAKYYEKLRGYPDMLAANVNHWLNIDRRSNGPDNRMVRTLGGSIRAFLSDRYRRIDNAQVAETVLPLIGQMDGAVVKSCEVTEDRMYLKVVNPRLTTEVKKGDIVQSGILISNSEVGLGCVVVAPLIYRLVCTNGMIAQDTSANRYRKQHVGRVNEIDVEYTVLRDETIEAEDKALMMRLQDAVSTAMNEAVFAGVVDKMRSAGEARIEAATVPKVVERVSTGVGLQQSEQDGILGHLIEGGELSLYGLGNAVTRYAQDVKSYDRSTELEGIGYKVMTLSPARFNAIKSIARKEV